MRQEVLPRNGCSRAAHLHRTIR